METNNEEQFVEFDEILNFIHENKEVIGDKNVKKYNTAKSRANQIETDIENDIAAQTKAIDKEAYTNKYQHRKNEGLSGTAK